MSTFISAIDNFTPTQLGENGHTEYGWSNSVQEKIVQLFFQLTRVNGKDTQNLESIMTDLLTSLRGLRDAKADTNNDAEKYLSILFRMTAQTRDIVEGKGEYNLAYMMVYSWSTVFPELAKKLLRSFVIIEGEHPYGSWKDLKYFCAFCRRHSPPNADFMMDYAVELMVEQLHKDEAALLEGKQLSLLAKWIPREKSAFGWLYQRIAEKYYSNIMSTAKPTETSDTHVKNSKASLKCMTHLRKLLSNINRTLDTVQIKQCANTWSRINFDHVTSITMARQKKTFLNLPCKSSKRACSDPNIRVNTPDRIECANNLNAHIEAAVKGEKVVKGKRVGMEDFTRQAFDHEVQTDQTMKNLIDCQWKDNATQTGALGKMIAMVDVSGSMNGDPMHAAIALGIRISEKSLLGNRVMTFSQRPKWVNLDGFDSFVDKALHVRGAEWAMNTDFHAALDMILEAIVNANMAPADVEDMILVILSDMQMDHADSCRKDKLYSAMEKKYADAGLRSIHQVPYKPPHILFWNLRSTTGFPTLSSQKNTSMMSGFSAALLNEFCEKGVESLQSVTPWSQIVSIMDKPRYAFLNL